MRTIRFLFFLFLLALPVAAQTSPGNIQPSSPAAGNAQNAVTANSNGTAFTVRFYGSAQAGVTIAGTATVNFEGQPLSGASWEDRYGYLKTDSTKALVKNTTASGTYFFDLAGDESFRARVSGCSACTVTVTIKGVPATARVGVPSSGGGGVSGSFTSGQVAVANGASSLAGDSDFTFLTDTLTVTKAVIGGGSPITSSGPGGALGSNAFTSTAYVPQTTTVNSKALNTNITLGLASSDFANQGTTTTILHGNAAGNPAFGQVVNTDITNGTIDLTTKVTGILPGANGGTGVNNGSSTITTGGNVVFSGAFNPTFGIPSSSTWNFPSGGGTLLVAGGPLFTLNAGSGTGLTVPGAVTQGSTVTVGSNADALAFGSLTLGFGSTTPPSGPTLNVVSTLSTSPRGIASMQFSTDTNGARVGFFKARGTVASPTTVVTGDTLGRLMFRGYVGSTNVYVESASIEAISTGTVADTSTGRLPSKVVISTSTDASPSVLTAALSINETQQLQAADGSAAAPTYSFASETGMGATRTSSGIYGFYVGGVRQFDIRSSGQVFIPVDTAIINFGSGADTILSRAGAANFRFGASAVAAPVAQTLSVQNVVAGTSNTAGADWTIKDSAGTGTGAGGSIIFQVAPAGSTGTSQNSFTTAFTIAGSGDIQYTKTITTAGTTGAQTINKTTGAINFAAAATSLVVTNSLVSANSIIQCTVATNDTTMKSAQCVAGSGSFTVYANAAATAETRVNFTVTN